MLEKWPSEAIGRPGESAPPTPNCRMGSISSIPSVSTIHVAFWRPKLNASKCLPPIDATVPRPTLLFSRFCRGKINFDVQRSGANSGGGGMEEVSNIWIEPAAQPTQRSQWQGNSNFMVCLRIMYLLQDLHLPCLILMH